MIFGSVAWQRSVGCRTTTPSALDYSQPRAYPRPLCEVGEVDERSRARYVITVTCAKATSHFYFSSFTALPVEEQQQEFDEEAPSQISFAAQYLRQAVVSSKRAKAITSLHRSPVQQLGSAELPHSNLDPSHSISSPRAQISPPYVITRTPPLAVARLSSASKEKNG